MIIRPFKQKDLNTIGELFDPKDEEYYKTCTVYYLSEPDSTISDDQKYGWGLFIEDEIVSCLTIGTDEVSNEPDTWFIGDVYTKPKYRGNKYAIELIKEVINQLNVNYATIGMPEETLIDFYKLAGFEINAELNRMDYRRDHE